MHLLMMISAAFAQTTPSRSLADDPNHDGYVQAIEDLDWSTPITPGVTPQIAPGTVGIIKVNNVVRGHLLAIDHETADHMFVESLVYQNIASVTAAERGFTLSFGGFVDNDDALNAQLTAWKNGPNGAQLQGAADASGGIGSAKFLVSNNLIPDDGQASNPYFQYLSPISSDKIKLLGYELVQGGAVVGWLMREKRDYASEIVIVDHWYYRVTFDPVSSDPTTTLTVQSFAPSNPSGLWTMSEFITAIKAVAPPSNNFTGLARRQVGMYTLAKLGDQMQKL